MRKLFTIFIGMIIIFSLSAQDDWSLGLDNEESNIKPSFNDTRVANGHSVEVLEKKTLDLRISHRFGNIADKNAGHSIIGLYDAQDIRIGADYGINDKLMIGFGRSQGTGPYYELWDGLIKYNIFKFLRIDGQKSNKIPFSLTFASSAFCTSMRSSEDTLDITYFDNNELHRLSYYSQIILAYNLKNRISVQLAPGLLHRNYVAFEDQNSNFVLGAMLKIKLMKKVSLLGEYYLVMRKQKTINNNEYINPLAISVEIKTHAHSFQINFMNSRGIGEGQFIPYTSSKWLDGEFRLGFTISRHF